MRNVLGNALTLTLFGESHGEGVGAVLDGLTPGVEINEERIALALARRRPSGDGETSRVEKDEFKILSGVYRGRSNGEPLTIFIPNQNVHSEDYEDLALTPRPGQADYASHIKFHGYEDQRGGGHFSGRLTVAIVAIGSILIDALKKFDIHIGSHILQLGKVEDDCFSESHLKEEILKIEENPFPLLKEVQKEMEQEILQAKSLNDSIGGTIETAVVGIPAGLGEPWFTSFEGEIARAMFSFGGSKGVSFGSGASFGKMKGSEANDPYILQDGKVVTSSNHNGGISGGISNGMPILFQTVIRPTPSIGIPQKSVNLSEIAEKTILVKGRHDPCIVRRVVPVINALTAFVICDFLVLRYGEDVFLKEALD